MTSRIKNQYLRFILGSAILIFLVMGFDRATGNLLRKLYFTQKSGLLYRTTYSIDSTKAEILVFGSSRANHHYVPGVFEDSLNMSFYNTGRDGNSILYNYAVFRCIIERYSPKIVILDFSPDALCQDAESYDRLSSLLPYYQDHKAVRPILNLRSPFEQVKLLFRIYPFNSLFLSIGIGNLEINKSRKSDDKGYVPLFKIMANTQLANAETTIRAYDTNKVNALKSIASLCKKKNITLLLVRSPVFLKVMPDDRIAPFHKLINELNIGYWDYANEPTFIENHSLFQDIGHLNHHGAVLFSSTLSSRIKDYLL